MKPPVKYKLSAISYRPLAISYQLLAILAISCLFFSCKSREKTAKVPIKNDMQAVTTVVPSKAVQKIDLPVFIPVVEIQNQINKTLFDPGYGKYYVCTGQPNCDKKFKDLYLEKPIISVNGDHISIRMHWAGVAHLLFLNPAISSDVTLTATPEVRNDTLYFRHVKLEQSSDDILLNLTSALFEADIEQKIQQNAWYSFRPNLDAIASQAKKQFPIKYGGAVLLLNLTNIYLKKVSIETAPDQGIIADFSADLEEEDSSFGR